MVSYSDFRLLAVSVFRRLQGLASEVSGFQHPYRKLYLLGILIFLFSVGFYYRNYR